MKKYTQNEANEACGKVLHALRKQKGMTQKDLAEQIGIQQHSISQHENGKRRINLAKFLNYCLVLEVDPAEAFAMIWEELRT